MVQRFFLNFEFCCETFEKLLIRIARQAEIWERKDRTSTRSRAEDIEEGISVIDFRDRLKNTLQTNADPLKNEALNMQNDRIK